MLENCIIIDELDVTTGWTASGVGATVALDTVNFRSGGAGLKLTVPVSIAGVATKTFGSVLNLSGYGPVDQVRLWIYIDNVARVSSATIQLIDNAGSPVTSTYTLSGLVTGWQRISVAKSAFTNYTTINWSAIQTAKFNVTATAGGTVNVTFDMYRLMVGPTIGYTMGTWDETTGLADSVDNTLKFFDAGYWQYTDSDIKLDSGYRLTVASVGPAPPITLSVGYIRISGNGASFKTLEIWNSEYIGHDRLVSFQPIYYKDSKIMDAIRTAQGYQLERSLILIIDSFRQDFAQWASYTLRRHELEIGVGAADSSQYSLDKRRIRIKAQYVVARLPKNIIGMQQVVENFVKSALVTHNPKTYSMTVQIIDPKGTPVNLSEIQNAIEQAKPAHLGYTLTYTF